MLCATDANGDISRGEITFNVVCLEGGYMTPNQRNSYWCMYSKGIILMVTVFEVIHYSGDFVFKH